MLAFSSGELCELKQTLMLSPAAGLRRSERTDSERTRMRVPSSGLHK